uniref:Ran GTPase-activating protein 1 n=1 Tax=Erythrolobus australicus TaxID=1077150 RepID=A0A7S1XHW4_9RHOD
MLDAATAKTHLAPLLAGAETGFESVDLSGKSLGEDAAPVAAEALASAMRSGRVRVLSLADIIAGRPEDEALRVLRTVTNTIANEDKAMGALEELDLSDNALGAKGVTACGALLENARNLARLTLCNNGLAADAIDNVTRALTANATATTKLKTLHFFNNLMESAGARALVPLLRASPALEDFRFSSLRVARDGGEAIAAALAECPELQRVDLSDNTLGERAAMLLADAIRAGKLPKLVSLNMRDTAISDAGALALLRALAAARHSAITTLDVSGNELTARVCSALGSASRALPALRELRAEENEFGARGGRILAARLAANSGPRQLRELTVASCEIGGPDAVAEWLKLAEAAPALQKLNLNGNAFPEDTLDELRRAFGDILGSLSDNDEDLFDEDADDEDDDDVEEEEEEEEDKDDLERSALNEDEDAGLAELMKGAAVSTT